MTRRLSARLALFLLVAGSLCLPACRSDDRAARRKAFEAYDRGITKPVKLGGFVIEQGMKPAVRALGAGQQEPAPIEAVGWINQLETVRKDVAKLHAPARLQGAAKDLDTALGLYIEAAQTIGAAGMGQGEPRTRLLERAVATARQADEMFDRAGRSIQRERKRIGLPPSALFGS